MKYGLVVPMIVTGGGDDLLDMADEVTEALANLEECSPELLDCAVSADAGTRTVVVELTVEAESVGKATDLGLSYIRTAIHHRLRDS